ncbi:hypothetical protein LCGC14_0264320 [marine sediment metagenome]|uniref:Uncharacterized protein n=1 Tax=marine sediment metagenome TaxID=412755 RepID=A0A0F9U0X4_9ZZZZ
MEMKTPNTECEFKTDEHLLKIRRGNSEFDYSWELYSSDVVFDNGARVSGEHFVGGGSPSFDGCIKVAEDWGFGISFHTPVMRHGLPGPRNVTGSGE